ncbi:MAG: hypothetical protein OEN21_18050 [Myxococcales bacterium]|nr:hypothetical protein [Myxococcales bacterium]
MQASASVTLTAAAVIWLGSVAIAEPGPLPRFVGTDLEQDEILEVISSADSRSFKPVGHSSVVLRMRTVERVTAALRIRSHEIQDGYRYEIAAYRISRLLGLDNVPPAVYRRATWKEINQRFHEDMLDRRRAIRRAVLWDEDGSAPAAAVYWIKGLRSVGLENKASWQSWLQDGDIPRGKTALARDLSTMTVFDLLIGNWDRVSGGNLPTDRERQRAFLRDNDRAFSTPLLRGRYEKLLKGFTGTKRFSKDLILHLAALDEASIRNELARDPSQQSIPLLSDAQIAEVLNRRSAILSYIAALIQEHGEAEVLFFP